MEWSGGGGSIAVTHLGHAEVDESQEAAGVEQQILGLEVAVDDGAVM